MTDFVTMMIIGAAILASLFFVMWLVSSNYIKVPPNEAGSSAGASASSKMAARSVTG
jgi:hypothetical protein